MTPADRHLIERLVAFFATGDSIVSDNLVISLYRHINSPEARMYLSRQLFEEALHDPVLPDAARQLRAGPATAGTGVRGHRENIPSIRRKAEFCQKWIDAGVRPAADCER